MTSEITGADIVVRCLAEEGVEHVFGYPGGAVLYIYDAIFKQDKFQHVLVRHEQAAIHAADAYSRSSNKVGVALVTSGPGVTNAVTGLATAHMDSIPMVVITGQVPTHAIGQDAFQECDTVGITRPCVKHNFLVKDVKDLASVMKKAFYIAQTGRPGPVLVDIPKDITIAKASFDYPKEVDMRSYKPAEKGHAGQIRRWCHSCRCCTRSEPAGRQAWLSVYEHADGFGWLSCVERQVCRHARHARHL
jgi:acetolactate synthase-1/2/3 large subunit